MNQPNGQNLPVNPNLSVSWATAAPAAKPTFAASRREVVSACIAVVMGYCYIDLWLTTGVELGVRFLLFVAAFTVWVLFSTWGRRRSRESWVWLGCLWVTAFCITGSVMPWNTGRIWENDLWPWLAVHGLAIYWVLSASNRLMRGESSGFLPLDAVNGTVHVPFKHYALKLRTLWWGLTHRSRTGGKKGKKRALYGLLALLVAAVLFYGAGNLLMAADDTFQAALSQVWRALDLENLLNSRWVTNFLLRFFPSLPVASYLCGLVNGSLREKRETLARQESGILRGLAHLRKVPSRLWDVLLAAFLLFYLAFFVAQGSTLMGAFVTHTAPGTFTLAQYARQGFFELCKIMALNFALLGVVQASREQAVGQSRIAKLLCTLLLAESLLFAATATAKLALYIRAFGFTPLRFQSAWAVLVLSAGCVCALIHLWTGKKTARAWVLFAGITFALSMVY